MQAQDLIELKVNLTLMSDTHQRFCHDSLEIFVSLDFILQM